ncbi:glycosyltransferase [Microbacterium sp. KR10-403]|uniref:glycosyltransferase n=1 Tax=Microbacterium sp. KR10-403 TaxID=3158581 RepID=UPI0032E38E18
MHPTPRVSIVLPLYNDASTVAATIDSCLAQTLHEVEIICIDDASTDATVEVVAEYAERDPRVRLLRQAHNSSAFQARRVGVSAAAAGHILFVDGDDELAPEAAAKSLAMANAHAADLVGFGVDVISLDGGVVGGYQSRLAPKHTELAGADVLAGLFPVGQPAQGQLWRYLFRTELLRKAYSLLPEGLVLPRVNDLPITYVTAMLASSFVSMPDRLYRYHYGRGGSGQSVETLTQAQFYARAIESIESVRPAVKAVAYTSADPGALLENYESVRLSIIGYVCTYLLQHTRHELRAEVLEHLHSCAPAQDIVLAAVRFYPDALNALKAHSEPIDLTERPVRSVMLTTRTLTTGGVSGVVLAQASLLMRAGYQVTIVARRYGSDPTAVPDGATFTEMVGHGLAERLVEWVDICQLHSVDVIIDHQVLYSQDWPEYALIARSIGVATIGWLHNFAARPIYDLNGLHELIKTNARLLATLVSLSPLDVAFWKLCGVPQAVYVPNPPSPLLLELTVASSPKTLQNRRLELIWWGRLDEHTKRVTQLLEVADKLRGEAVDFHLTIVGPDWQEWTARRFNTLARKRGLDHLVEAVGEKRGQDLVDAIDAADIFVTTSIIEGYQLTIAEAQSRGLPVFMYALPWLTLVQENDGVVSVPQGDAAAMATRIAEFACSSERYTELSRASLEAARRELTYDFGRLYEQVITGSLPSKYSPEPTFTDAQQLLRLVLFYAEQNAGVRDAAKGAATRSRSSGRRGAHSSSPARSLRSRVWRAATPLGRTVLQLFPNLRPLAHRAKTRLTGR